MRGNVHLTHTSAFSTNQPKHSCFLRKLQKSDLNIGAVNAVVPAEFCCCVLLRCSVCWCTGNCGLTSVSTSCYIFDWSLCAYVCVRSLKTVKVLLDLRGSPSHRTPTLPHSSISRTLSGQTKGLIFLSPFSLDDWPGETRIKGHVLIQATTNVSPLRISTHPRVCVCV